MILKSVCVRTYQAVKEQLKVQLSDFFPKTKGPIIVQNCRKKCFLQNFLLNSPMGFYMQLLTVVSLTVIPSQTFLWTKKALWREMWSVGHRFRPDVHSPQRIKLNDFGDFLAFPLSPPARYLYIHNM